LLKNLAVVQKIIAAPAESANFVEKNPQPAMAAVGKIPRINDSDTLRSAYEAYALSLIKQRMTVPRKWLRRRSKLRVRTVPQLGASRTRYSTTHSSTIWKRVVGWRGAYGWQKVVAKRRSCLLCFLPIRSRSIKGGVFPVDLTSQFYKAA
jgi:hypothetical protein